MSRIYICYTTCSLENQTVVPTIPGFKGINQCGQYISSCPHKPIFHPSNSYDVSNVIILTWSGNKVEEYTTQNIFRLPSKCRSCYNYQNNTVIFRYYSSSVCCSYMLEITDSTGYNL